LTDASLTPARVEISFLGLTLPKVQAITVWLMFASSFFVKIEPAPCDVLFVVAFALHLRSGLTVTALVWPMILYLLLYNLGGFISFLEVSNENKAGMFVVTTAYMSMSGMFMAFFVAHNPLRNIAIVRNGYVIGAFIASVIGIAGYFNMAGLGDYLSPEQRVQGLFKDPNVVSTYLILPALLLIQGIMLGKQKHPVIGAVGLLVILAAWFLAFSRGAWISLIASTVLMIILTFALTPSQALRSRIIILSITGAGVAAALVMLLLSIPEVRELFFDRLTLVKYYDAGETGRFGNQINSIQYLLQRPLGFGPTLFRKIFGADPHNVFLNAFASYGWLGGLSYFLLIVSTLMAGFRSLLAPTPWQKYAIVIYCGLLTTILQGVQIDTDHWRHFYWMLGMNWGLFAASLHYIPQGRWQSVDDT
jgi:hypothetical protein